MIKIRVKVIGIKENYVKVSSQYGQMSGMWNGELPKLHTVKEVEIEIDSTLKWSEDIVEVEETQFKYGNIENKVFIIGCIEAVEDDGYTVIRFGDSIVTIDTEGEPFSKGKFVKLVIDKLEFYDEAL